MHHVTTRLSKSILALALLLMGVFAGQAQADNLTWTVTSDHPNIVDVEFYSQSRNVSWPGNGRVYVIDDWDAHTYSLSCNRGERICFGAWVRGRSSTYWGVGSGGRNSCADCCAICGAGTPDRIRLTP